jgi:hypothetical protein
MRCAHSAAFALLLAGTVAGCGDDLSRSFGITRDVPDEFTVTTRAPLSMPPDFELRPPRPGAPRPQEQDAPVSAEEALVPQTALEGAEPGAAASPGQQALVAEAGPPAPANIRQKIERDSALDQPSQSLTDRLMFWKPAPLPGVVVDPNKESDRLRTNAALGEPPTTGNTPIIQRQSSGDGGGLLSGIF